MRGKFEEFPKFVGNDHDSLAVLSFAQLIRQLLHHGDNRGRMDTLSPPNALELPLHCLQGWDAVQFLRKSRDISQRRF
jgi:hypothetical protein